MVDACLCHTMYECVPPDDFCGQELMCCVWEDFSLATVRHYSSVSAGRHHGECLELFELQRQHSTIARLLA